MGSIAIVGSGISGLTAAYYLSRKHRVCLYEANDKPGGHTDTREIVVAGREMRVDTGFIVYNDRTYPNFIRLLDQLGCDSLPTEMSFSVSTNHFEYNGYSLNTMFAQRSNLLRPGFLRMIADILRFNRKAKAAGGCRLTIGEYLEAEGYGSAFREGYLYPMAAAIWSTGCEPVRSFPAAALIRFFTHHGLLSLTDRPQWRVIKGGSALYVDALSRKLPIRAGTPVRKITRSPDGVTLHCDGSGDTFDQVVIATHSDQALALLDAPTRQETEILGAIRYTANRVTLHTDTTVMPKRELAWASWNYRLGRVGDRATLTYHMNRLQHLPHDVPVLLTLNDHGRIDESKIIEEFSYSHPFFDRRALDAQERYREISGHNRTFYAGAYWRNGFHEDGVVSGLRVCKSLGAPVC